MQIYEKVAYCAQIFLQICAQEGRVAMDYCIISFLTVVDVSPVMRTK